MLDLGTSYETRNDIERAEAMYRRALSIDWKDADVHVRLGQILLRRGEHAEATREGQLALTFQPRSSRALALLERAGWRGER
jgi:Flp pilus assembly protein TadD